jgi:hypothetical protein
MTSSECTYQDVSSESGDYEVSLKAKEKCNGATEILGGTIMVVKIRFFFITDLSLH